MGRILCFVYGVVAYVAFLIAILYAIGFVTGFAVPKTIDNGETSSVAASILINVLLLGLFAIQHTIMARPAFKSWWTRFVPQPIERSTFVLFASLILIFTFWQWRPLPGIVWRIEQPWLAGAIFSVSQHQRYFTPGMPHLLARSKKSWVGRTVTRATPSSRQTSRT